MPINNISGLPGSSQAQRATDGSQVQVSRTEPTRQQDETGRPSTVDTVSLTDTAARLQGLETTLAQLPVVDSQRVETIQRAIEEGTFEVNAERIATKMLGFEGALDQVR